MKKYLVLYYSKTGNSKFIAEKVSAHLNGELKRINPLVDNVMILFLLTRLNIGIGTNISKTEMEDYDEVIVIGPLWGGLINAPLKNVLRNCFRAKKPLHFAMSCDIPEQEKDHKYGYAKAFADAKELGGSLMKSTTIFSNALVKKFMTDHNNEVPEKILLSDENFKGEIQERLQRFIQEVNED
ncbi:MAG: flavodoxin family protein [Saprospiraceae bacterium]|nr:flavodoxin family protein [Saprospiraceae bacterium]